MTSRWERKHRGLKTHALLLSLLMFLHVGESFQESRDCVLPRGSSCEPFEIVSLLRFLFGLILFFFLPPFLGAFSIASPPWTGWPRRHHPISRKEAEKGQKKVRIDIINSEAPSLSELTAISQDFFLCVLPSILMRNNL